jgi:hypothetical protein
MRKALLILTALFIGLIGWSSLVLAFEVANEFNSFNAGLTATLLFQVAVIYFAVTIYLAVDLFGYKEKRASDKRLLYILTPTLALSVLPIAILFFGPASIWGAVYLVVITLIPAAVFLAAKKITGELKISLKEKN